MRHALLLLAVAIAGCTTTRTDYPDGHSTTTQAQDPKVVKAVSEAVATAASKAAVQALENEANRKNGLP